VLVRRTEVDAFNLPDQSVLLFDKESGTAIPVSESAGKIWGLCDGAHTIDQIVDNLAVIYDVDRALIDRDTRKFLGELERRGFIKARSSFP